LDREEAGKVLGGLKSASKGRLKYDQASTLSLASGSFLYAAAGDNLIKVYLPS